MSDEWVILYDVEFTTMISDSDNTSDWHCTLITNSNISVTNEIGVAVIDVLAIYEGNKILLHNQTYHQ